MASDALDLFFVVVDFFIRLILVALISGLRRGLLGLLDLVTLVWRGFF